MNLYVFFRNDLISIFLKLILLAVNIYALVNLLKLPLSRRNEMFWISSWLCQLLMLLFDRNHCIVFLTIYMQRWNATGIWEEAWLRLHLVSCILILLLLTSKILWFYLSFLLYLFMLLSRSSLYLLDRSVLILHNLMLFIFILIFVVYLVLTTWLLLLFIVVHLLLLLLQLVLMLSRILNIWIVILWMHRRLLLGSRISFSALSTTILVSISFCIQFFCVVF